MKKGFTLIELLVVISIISLLSSVILASLTSARSKARDAQRKLDLHNLALAINNYYSTNGYLPRNANGWCTYITHPSYTAAFSGDLIPGYLPKLPTDPKNANAVGDYFYSNNNNIIGDFHVCAIMENSANANGSFNYSGCAGGSIYNYCISK
jgi:type II secretion system protein G